MSKNIVRVNKNNNYTVMSNYHLRDERLSWKAKGIHSYILSLPDDWKVVLEHLKTVSADGRDSTRTGIQELYDLRYWQRYAVYENGIIREWVTEIYEEPFPEEDKIKNIIIRDNITTVNYENRPVDNFVSEDDILLTDNPSVVENTDVDLLTENLQVGSLEVEKPELLNTNNTKDLSFTNHSINQEERLTDDKDPLAALSKKYNSDTITLALEKANNAKLNGTKINNLYAYLNKLCLEIEKEKEILGNVKTNKNKTKFHNFEGRSEKYSGKELEDMAKRKRQEYIDQMNKVRA